MECVLAWLGLHEIRRDEERIRVDGVVLTMFFLGQCLYSICAMVHLSHVAILAGMHLHL